jgi:hypothetical protein
MAWAHPVVIDQLVKPTRITRLEQYSNGSGGAGTRFREALLQELVHSSPECLPVEEIEPAFVGLRSICTELPLRRDSKDRYADNLLISPSGRICLVECKLASNGEADREVLSQLIDYAASLVELDYESLLDRVRTATRTSDGDPIVDAVLGPEADPDRREDLRAGIEHSLGRGEFLLLIVGDRIRSNTTKLVQLLQEHVDLGFSFGLIEMPVFSLGDQSGYLVQPRVVMKTELVTRTVFVAGDLDRRIVIRKVEPAGPAGNLSQREFYAALATADPGFPDAVRSLLARLDREGCEIDLLRSYNVYFEDGVGGRLNVLSIKPTGTVEIWATASPDAKLGAPVGHTYMERVAALLPGGRVNVASADPISWNIRVNKKVGIDLHLLLAHQDAWLNILLDLRNQICEIKASRNH